MAHHASMVEREDLVTEMDTAELHEEQVVILVTRVELLLTISHLSGYFYCFLLRNCYLECLYISYIMFNYVVWSFLS